MLQYDADAISNYGGENGVYIKQVNADGSDLASPDTWKPLGFIEKTTLRDKTADIDKDDETGNLAIRLQGVRKVDFEVICMQSSFDIIDFLRKDSRGNYYAACRDDGINSGNYQELFYPICMITNSYDYSTDDRIIPVTITSMINRSAITIPAVDLHADFHTSSDVLIQARDYYATVKTALS